MVSYQKFGILILGLGLVSCESNSSKFDVGFDASKYFDSPEISDEANIDSIRKNIKAAGLDQGNANGVRGIPDSEFTADFRVSNDQVFNNQNVGTGTGTGSMGGIAKPKPTPTPTPAPSQAPPASTATNRINACFPITKTYSSTGVYAMGTSVRKEIEVRPVVRFILNGNGTSRSFSLDMREVLKRNCIPFNVDIGEVADGVYDIVIAAANADTNADFPGIIGGLANFGGHFGWHNSYDIFRSKLKINGSNLQIQTAIQDIITNNKVILTNRIPILMDNAPITYDAEQYGHIYLFQNNEMMYFSPLVVNFSGRDIKLTNASQGVVFDIDADGKSDQVSWTSESNDSRFLALDLDENGQIDSGSELFGNFSKKIGKHTLDNGFTALSQYDDSHDGKIDAKDSVFKKLVLWRDRNHNGKSEASELTLASDLLENISLKYSRKVQFDQHGNKLSERSVARSISGKTLEVVDIWFQKAQSTQSLVNE